MRIYRKWFLVDITDKENHKVIFNFVNFLEENPKIETTWYEIDGVRYDVVSKSKWNSDIEEINRAKEREIKLNEKLTNMDKLSLLAEGPSIKEAVEETGYWKYQDIYVKKQQ